MRKSIPHKIKCNRTDTKVHFNIDYKNDVPNMVHINKSRGGSCVGCLLAIIVDLIDLCFELGASKIKVANRLEGHGCGFPVVDKDGEHKSCLDKFSKLLRKA